MAAAITIIIIDSNDGRGDHNSQERQNASILAAKSSSSSDEDDSKQTTDSSSSDEDEDEDECDLRELQQERRQIRFDIMLKFLIKSKSKQELVKIHAELSLKSPELASRLLQI